MFDTKEASLSLILKEAQDKLSFTVQTLTIKMAEFQAEKELLERKHLDNASEWQEKLNRAQAETLKACSQFEKMKADEGFEMTEAQYRLEAMNEKLQQLAAELHEHANSSSESALQVELLTEKLEQNTKDQGEECNLAETRLSKLKSENIGLLSKIDFLLKACGEDKRLIKEKDDALVVAKSATNGLEASILKLSNEIELVNVNLMFDVE